jgi:cellulose synthase/poly-beta-1,6-N-acetylglucosamine synthase-like glycosyltransferase
MSDVLNIKLINNEKNIGLPASLNKILSVSRGRYFVRVDCDDYVSDHFLYYMSLFLDLNRKNQAVACDYREVNNSGDVVDYHISSLENPIACGVMFTYEALCEIGFYDEKFKMREGHDLISRFLNKFKLFYLPVPLYRYRLHGANRTNNIEEVKKYDSLLMEDS